MSNGAAPGMAPGPRALTGHHGATTTPPLGRRTSARNPKRSPLKIVHALALAPLALLPSQCAPAVAHAAPPHAAPATAEGPSVDVWVTDSGGAAARSFTVKAPIVDRGETVIAANDGSAYYRVHTQYLEGDRAVRLKVERTDKDPGRAVKLETVLAYKPGERRVAGRIQREDGSVTEVTLLAR